MKVLCPKHDDTNPSMEIYPDGGFCFVCGAFIPIAEMPNEEGFIITKKENENVQEKIEYIKQLPSERIRGLSFPKGPEGFYIIWPGNVFYKLRTTHDQPRYKGPRGLRAPLFRLDGNNGVLVVVEGEINALSLAEAYPVRTFTIASPGSCSEFNRHVDTYKQFKTIIIFADNDPAGIANGYILKETLLKSGKSVILILLDTDFNDLLQQGGPELVRRVFNERTGL